MQLKTKILFRRDLYDNLKNLVLLEGEPCYATDTKQYVVGDGSSTFAELVATSQRLSYMRSNRDFENGTLIKTDLDYPVAGGSPFLVHIKSNSYGEQYPYSVYLQGYCYDYTIINKGGLSNGYNFPTEIYAISVGGKLCFW